MPPDTLKIALDKLASMGISKEAKTAIANTLKAASNPHAEDIDVVIKSLDKPRRKMIDKTAKGLRELNAEVMARGKGKIDGLSDDEWTSLIERSN